MSGHIHAFEAFSFGATNPPRVPQIVIGDSGTKLADKPGEPTEVDGVTFVNPVVRSKFKFMVWDRDGASWNGQLFDEAGSPIVRCRLIERDLSCRDE